MARITTPGDSYPQYMRAIEDALANGYRVETESGTVIGLKGAPLKLGLARSQAYPSVSLVTPNMPHRFYAVPAHKVVAYAIWGAAAFMPGVHVRHLNGNRLDCRAANLALGSASDNERDKSPEARSRVARLARLAQGGPGNRKITHAQAEEIRQRHAQERAGLAKLPNGALRRLMTEFNLSKTAIHLILNGVTYAS